MSEFTPVGQVEMIAAYQKLLLARTSAVSEDDKAAAEDDLAHYLRMLAAGRIQEWFASRRICAGDTE